MYPYYKPPIEQLLKLLSFSGVNPLKKSFVQTFLVTLKLTSIISTIYLIFVQFVYSDITMKLFVDSVESLFTSSQLLVKLVTFITKRREIRDLFGEVSKFWSLSQFDSVFRNECLSQLEFVKFVVKMFTALCASVMVFFMFCPIFADRLAIICYVPRIIPEPIFAAYNSWVFGYNGMGVVAFDCFVCTMVFLLHLQYKLLNKRICLIKLEKVQDIFDERKCLEEMKIIIKYHNFLWRFLARLNSILGFTSFIQFILYTISMCFEMYLVSQGSGNLEDLKSVFYITTLSFEMLLCFCIPSTYLTSEASRTLQVTYESKWYECRSKAIRKNILIIMARAQQVAALWAGKLFVINLETATEAFKKTLSFYTFLRTMGENS